jgi:PPOX class probable F420-dependent enzyme
MVVAAPPNGGSRRLYSDDADIKQYTCHKQKGPTMTAAIPSSVHDLLGERPIVCVLTTINPNGQPHSVPVWFDFDGTSIRVNSPDNARKARNMAVGSRVTVLVLDPENALRWVEIMGHVSAIHGEADGALEHISQLSLKYRGDPDFKPVGGQSQQRMMFVIEPDVVHSL